MDAAAGARSRRVVDRQYVLATSTGVVVSFAHTTHTFFYAFFSPSARAAACGPRRAVEFGCGRISAEFAGHAEHADQYVFATSTGVVVSFAQTTHVFL